MKKTLLALAVIGLSISAAQAAEVHGSVGMDSHYLSYGVDQNPNLPLSPNFDVHAEQKGFSAGVRGNGVEVNGSSFKTDVFAGYKSNLNGYAKLNVNVGHQNYIAAKNDTRNFNYVKGSLEKYGVYGQYEQRWGMGDHSTAAAKFYTVGYSRNVMPRLNLGVEATRRQYVAADVGRFNDARVYGTYAVTKQLDLLAQYAHGGKNLADADLGNASSVGVKYKF